MSENIEVKTTLTARDSASPVLKGFLANVRKLEASLKGFNSQFANIGRSGAASMATLSRATESFSARMNGVAASAKSTSQSIANDFRRSNNQRVNDARRMYSHLERMEQGYTRQIERRVAAERRADRHAGVRVGGVGGRLAAPRIRTVAIGGAIAAGGVAGAFKKRMEVEAAEVRTRMFGDLTKGETSALRKDFADRAGIKYGVGVTKALDAATEGLKAGIAKEVVGEFADLSLKAQAGLDIDAADTAKLLGRLSTQMPWSKARFSKILNAIAISNNATAASGSEIVEAMRRSLSALATTKMTPEQLAAIDSTGISLGIQPFKMGTFTSFLTSQIAGADSARGQQAKDLGHAANSLGFGSRAGMARAMRDNPLQAVQQILENLAKMPEKLRTKVAKEIGGREWMDELLTLVLGRDKLKAVIKEIADKPGFLDKTALQKIKSLQGQFSSITAAMGLVVEKIGGGFESAFDQISDAIINIADRFNFDTIRDHVAALVDGLRQGLRLRDWGEAVNAVAGVFDAGSIARWTEFGRGFAAGLKDFISTLKGAFVGLASLFGKGDTESMGRFTAQLLGLTVALAFLAPVVGVLASLGSILTGIALVAGGAATGIAALFVALSVGLKLSLSWVADRIFDSFKGIVDPVVAAIKSIATKTWDWVKGLFGFGGSSSGHAGGASGSWDSSATDFSGSRKRVAALTTSPVANIMPDVSGVTGGGLSRSAFDSTFKGTAMAGQHDAIVAAAKANGIPPALLAAVIAQESGRGKFLSGNNPGGVMDSANGWRTKKQFASLGEGIDATARTVAKNYKRAGGDVAKMGANYAPLGAANDPNGLNGSWVGGVTKFRNSLSGGVAGAGYAGLGDPVSEAKKYLGKNEYANRAELTQLVGHDVAGASNAWCARFVNSMIGKSGGQGTGSAVANSFLRYGQRIVDKSGVLRGDVLVQPNGRGVDQPGGHVGLATGRTRMKDGRLQLEMRSGNDGDSVRDSWRDASKIDVRRGITQDVPSAVANVPPSASAATAGLLQKHGSAILGSGAGGPVSVNINGNSHDPEALATLVQRRISEAMNWRTHDIDYSMT